MIELGIARHRPEERAIGYTDALVEALMRRAVSRDAVYDAMLGAVQVCAGILGRSLSIAAPTGDLGLLTAARLADIGSDLVRRGQSIWLFRVGVDGRPTLLRCDTADPVVHGGPDPRSWRYVLTLGAPSQQQAIEVGSESVMHVRWNAQALTPFRGRSPLELAAATGRLASGLSESLGNETAVAVARILAMPSGTGEATINELKKAIENPSQGRIALPPTTRSGFGEGQGSAPIRDWRSERLGFDAPTSAADLYKILLQEVGAVIGVPWSLMPASQAAGPAQREAQRQMLGTLVEPVGQLIALECGRVLEREVTLTHHRLAAADVAARARAVHVLTEVGIEKDRALELVGWS